jgi:hypothetical protein
VMAKLTTLGHIDSELRTLETGLHDRQPVTVLREAGVTACARCAAIHSSEDRFCPNCGLSLGPGAELPIAGAAASPLSPSAADAPTPPPAPAQAEQPLGPSSAPAPSISGAAPTSGAAPVAARAGDAKPPAPDRQALPAGRSPRPRRAPHEPAPQAAQTSSGEEEPTEILHPPSTGA